MRARTRSDEAPAEEETTPTIAIIGAGFSGTLLSLHVLRRCPPRLRVLLIERNARFGHGQAYSTGNSSHLLNVPAGRMSAFHDKPGDFLEWLQAHPEPQVAASTTACFVPRHVYGSYIRHVLKEELRRADPGRTLELVRGEVRSVDAGGARLSIELDRGRVLQADIAVLATGNFPPEPPPIGDPSFYDGPHYRPDPWSADALTDLAPDEKVLLIGTGLTTVDVAISLLDQGHAGPIQALSRRGLLPQTHGAAERAPSGGPAALPTRLSMLLRATRTEIERTKAEGGHWRAVIDDLRPFTQDLWQAMSEADKRRFLRHLRRWWDVHRHRIAPAVADRFEAARSSGQLSIHAGRLRSLTHRARAVEAVFAPAGGGAERILRAGRVINCAGPGADYDRIRDPLVQALLRSGLARPDPMRLGLDVAGTCALRDRDGAISRRLFTVGPPTKGTFWEMTAVPDIRRQCELLAANLAILVRMSPAARV